MIHLPKRRWLTFSVRTLLIAVTILCVWIAWQVSVVRERKAMRSWVEDGEGWVNPVTQPRGRPGAVFQPYFADRIAPEPTVSIWRQWLGDEPIQRVVLPYKTEAPDRIRARKVFPEARVINVLVKVDENNHPLP